MVGRRIAQIVFFETEGILNKSYEINGKYQTSSDMEELKKIWKPTDMLPKMYRDREISARNSNKKE